MKISAIYKILISLSIFSQMITFSGNVFAQTWQTPTTIAGPLTSAPGTAPLIASLPNGSALAVWEQATPSAAGKTGYVSIWSSVRTNNTWSVPEEIVAGNNSPLEVSERFPAIAVAQDGAVTLVWFHSNCTSDLPAPNVGCSSSVNEVRAKKRSSAGTWSLPQTISTPGNNPGSPLRVGVALDGSVQAAWIDGALHSVVVAAAAPNSGFTAPQTISPVVAASSPSFDMNLAVAADGGAAVSYAYQTDLFNIYVAIKPPGSSVWQNPILFSDRLDGFGNASLPHVAIANGGKTTAIWQQYNATVGKLLLRTAVAPAGVSANPPSILSTDSLDSVPDPQVVTTLDGSVIASWIQLPYRRLSAAKMSAGSNSFATPVFFTSGFTNQAGDTNLAAGLDDSAALIFSISQNIIQAALLSSGADAWTPAIALSGTGKAGPKISVNTQGTASAIWGGIGSTNFLFKTIEASTTLGGGISSVPTPTPTPTSIPNNPSNDLCPNDAAKTLPGICGCGFPEADINNDTVIDCGTPRVFSKSLKAVIASARKSAVGKATLVFEKFTGKNLSFELTVTGLKHFKKVVASTRNQITVTGLIKNATYTFKVVVLQKIPKKSAVKSKASAGVTVKV